MYEKIDFICTVDDEIEKLVVPILRKRAKEYKKKFGGFSKEDLWLWLNINMRLEVASSGARIMDAE